MRIKILLIDDDEDDFFIISQYFKDISEFDIECVWSYNISDAQKKLNSNDFDVCFIDYRLGARTGLELLTEAIQNGCIKPIILLTGKGNTLIDKQSVEAGAYDYLIKAELNADKLERCIRYALERFKAFKLIMDNEKKYRQIFENAISFIFICDADLKVVEANNACEFFIGYTSEEIKNNLLIDFVEKQSHIDFLNESIINKNTVSGKKIKFKSKTGEIKTGSLFLEYFQLDDDSSHWQGILFDETIREQAELTKLHN